MAEKGGFTGDSLEPEWIARCTGPPWTPMRIRIIKRPPKAYDTEQRSLRVGHVYNLDSAVASALIADACAELDEAMSADERRERDTKLRGEMWEASDREHAPQWLLLKPDAPSDLT